MEKPDPKRWRDCSPYLYGIDLFNHGFYWEAHEVWEGLWKACSCRGPTASFLKGLIHLAAAGLKARMGNLDGVKRHAQRVARLFHVIAAEIDSRGPWYMGLDVVRSSDGRGALSNNQACARSTAASPA